MRKLLGTSFALLLLCAVAPAVDFNSACYTNSNHEVFVSGFQRFATLKSGDGNISRTKYNPTAGAVGYQYSTPQWSAGLSMSFENGDAKHRFRDGADQAYFKVRDRTLGFTLFGTYTAPTKSWYAKGALFTGFSSQKAKNGYYNIAGAAGRYGDDGSDDTTRFGASIELGKLYEFGDGFRLTPHVGFDYAHAPGDEIKFRDLTAGGSRYLTARSQNFYEVPLGVTLARDFTFCDWVLTPSVDLTLVSSFGNISADNMNYRTGFASNSGRDWKVYGVGADHWGGRITAGVRAVKSERFDLDLNYAYEGRKDYNDHRITAAFGIKF